VTVTVDVAIATYRRSMVLCDTLEQILRLPSQPDRVIVADQTEHLDPQAYKRLSDIRQDKRITYLHVERPNIPGAMNRALKESSSEIIIFLDDDVLIESDLVGCYRRAFSETGADIIVGQIVQPWQERLPPESSAFVDGREIDPDAFLFNSAVRRPIERIMATNFAVKRKKVLGIGGFDENFVRVAYRFEAEFSERALAYGLKIFFEPSASIRHLRVGAGGTRSYGEHLRTAKPAHTVGQYYYLLRSRTGHKISRILSNPFKAISTRHHLSRPWWIPATLAAELLGFLWACGLYLRGGKYAVDKQS